MGRRQYGQFCGVARALEMVGERWALLIIRDLLVGPRRFTDLHRGLPKIPTNILSARLKELEQHGIVRRNLLPRPAGSVVYELTDFGQELDGIVLALGRWGSRKLGDAAPGEIVTVDSLVTMLRTTFHPESARGVRLGFELRWGEELIINARVDDGSLAASPGSLPAADLVIEPGKVLKPMMTGLVRPADAIKDGSVRVNGDPRLLTRFIEMFHLMPSAAGSP